VSANEISGLKMELDGAMEANIKVLEENQE